MFHCELNDVEMSNDVYHDAAEYFDDNIANDVSYLVNDVSEMSNDVHALHYSVVDDDVSHDVYFDACEWFDVKDVNVSNEVNENVQCAKMCEQPNEVNCFKVCDTDEWSVTFQVGATNQGSIQVEIDTGAQCNVINQKTVEKLELSNFFRPSHVTLNGVNNSKKSSGVIVIPCIYKSNVFNLQFQVLESEKVLNLNGRKDASRLGLVARVNAVVEDKCQSVVSKFKVVFTDKIGCLPGQYQIKVDPSVSPVVHTPRPIPVAIRTQVKEELDQLEHAGVIAKVSNSTKWVSSMVVVRKKNNKIRICIDPTDLN